MNDDSAATVDRVIQGRRTTKMLADEPLPPETDRVVINELIAAAGWAPFHKPAAKVHREQLDSIVPWRCHALDAPACRELRAWLLDQGDETKVPKMLAAADALVLVNWLPNLPKTPLPPDALFDPTRENMEHIAAASAAIQNLLLAATARALPSYWSSGGPLRDPATFARLGIPAGEVLLGAIFLFPTDPPTAVDASDGKLRDLRGRPNTWARWVG